MTKQEIISELKTIKKQVVKMRYSHMSDLRQPISVKKMREEIKSFISIEKNIEKQILKINSNGI